MSSPAPNALAGVLGAAGGIIHNDAQTNTQNTASGLLTSAPMNSGTTGVSSGSGTSTFQPGSGTNITPTGALGTANSGIQGMASAGAAAGNNILKNGAPASVTGASNTANALVNPQLAALTQAQAGGSSLVNAGTGQLSNPLIGQADAAASSNINQAGTNFNDVYNTQLTALMKQLQLPQQLQMNANNQGQFSRGQMGTTGGALQTQAMATGFGQADLAAAGQAYNQAIGEQGQATSAAGVLGTLASNQSLTGANMIGTGTNAVTGTSGAATNTATAGLGNALTGAAAPATLAGAYNQNVVTPSVANTGAINTQGINTAQLGLNTGYQSGALDVAAGNGLTTLGTSNNNSQSTLANLLSAGGGANLSSLVGSGTSALSNIFGGSNTSAAANTAGNSGLDAASQQGLLSEAQWSDPNS